MKRKRPAFQSVEHQVENKGKRRRKNRDEYNKLDRISALPDHILVYLVSRLPLKEAVGTSVLSRRWQNVGLSTTTLRFDAVDFSIPSNFRRYWPDRPEEFIEQEGWKYINWVNHVLQQHRGQHVKVFRVSFCLDSRFSSFINGWIQFAMENRVEVLELDFYPEAFMRFKFKDYKFPHKLLEPGIPSPGSCGLNNGFKSLKVLQIRHVGVTGELLEYFLSSCPLLERLSVNHSDDLVNLRVVGPSIALKYLVIQNCYNLKSIEIRDINIVSFIYGGYCSTNLVISNAPLLSEVTFLKKTWRKDFIREFFTQCCICNIENLKLHIHGAAFNESPALPLLANLKHLELQVVADYYRALHHLNNFLKASPHLLTLILKLEQYEGGPIHRLEVGEIEKAPDCSHNHLKVVEIVGYRAHTSGVEHAMYLIKNVLALEKIVVDPVRRWRYPHGVDRPDTELHKEVKARDHAEQYLKPKIPATVEFVCL